MFCKTLLICSQYIRLYTRHITSGPFRIPKIVWVSQFLEDQNKHDPYCPKFCNNVMVRWFSSNPYWSIQITHYCRATRATPYHGCPCNRAPTFHPSNVKMRFWRRRESFFRSFFLSLSLFACGYAWLANVCALFLVCYLKKKILVKCVNLTFNSLWSFSLILPWKILRSNCEQTKSKWDMNHTIGKVWVITSQSLNHKSNPTLARAPFLTKDMFW